MEEINTDEKKLVVSDEFIELFRLFNVIKVTDRMDLLSSKERKLLLLLATENFSETSPFVVSNIMPYKSELQLLYDLQMDEKTEDPDLMSLAEESGDKCIDSGTIFDSVGNKIPKATTDEEAVLLRRDMNISDLIG